MLVVVLVAMAAAVMVTLSMASASSGQQVRHTTQRTLAIQAAHAGTVEYLLALRGNGVGDGASGGWRLDAADMERIANESMGRSTFYPEGDRRIPAGLRDRPTIRMQAGAGAQASYWQVFRVQPPAADRKRATVTVWFRGWAGTQGRAAASGDPGTSAIKPQVVATSYRRGMFSDFLMVYDRSTALNGIFWSSNTVFDGKVHSNGEDRNGPGAGGASWRGGGATYGTPTCTGRGRVSAHQGGFVDFGTSCKPRTGAPKVDFLNADITYAELTDACGSPEVFCPGTGGTVEVTLSGDTVQVGGTTRSLGALRGILLPGNAWVRGTLDGRLTIAVRGSLYLDGSIRRTGTSSVLGLLAQGDVHFPLVDRDGTVCGSEDRLIEAAIMSEHGVTRVWPGAPQQDHVCGALGLEGSIIARGVEAARYTVIAADGTTTEYGFSERSTKSFDEMLPYRPPPYFPMTNAWSVAQTTVGDLDCANAGASC